MASTAIDYERWHDGEGYDLDALRELKGRDRQDAERWLLDRAGNDWRDLEGLMALGDPPARFAVVRQLRDGSMEQRLAAAGYLNDDPSLAADREAAVIAGLGSAVLFSGLTRALDLAVELRTPAILEALFRATLRDEGEVAIHPAARIAFVYGKGKDEFDWDLRPLFLRFNTQDRGEREAALRDLCALCGVDPEPYLRQGS